MKKIIFGLILLIPAILSAQSYNPFVSTANITPAPMPDLQLGGSAFFNFTVGNSGTTAMPVMGTQALVISISMLRGVPNTAATPPSGVTGPWAQYFSWTYDAFVQTLVGTQILTIPANDSGMISIDYLVTSNSTPVSPQNGFNINLVPAPYSAGSNSQSDDNVSAFTYTTSVPLEAEILGFTGKKMPVGNLLSWITNSENNSSHFEIYYGKNSNEMEKLVRVVSKAQSDISSEELTYEYLHNAPKDGANYYRLHSFNKDGVETVHNTLNLYLKNQSTLSIYPNPTKSNINISYRNGEIDIANISVTDLQGRVIYKKKTIIYNNSFSEVIPMKEFTAGTYLLNITDGVDYSYIQKISKQ